MHAFFTLLFVLSMQLGSVIWNVPLLAYHIHRYVIDLLMLQHSVRYMNRPVMSCPGLYDPTTIMNADQLSRSMREGWIKLGFYLISFFYYLYAYVCTYIFLLPSQRASSNWVYGYVNIRVAHPHRMDICSLLSTFDHYSFHIHNICNLG